MKKFVLATVSTAALAMASAAFAAPLSLPTPTVDNVPLNASAISLVSQTGDNDNANVDQSGSNGAAVGVKSTVTQKGDNDTAKIIQTQGYSGADQKDVSTVTQNGDSNFAKVVQNARFTSTITQNGDHGTALVTQNYSQGGPISTSTITQHSGNYNYAKVSQFDDGASSTIDQTGNSNKATVDQVYNDASTITQTRGEQTADVKQGTGGMVSTVVQGGIAGGVGNTAVIRQGVSGPGYQSATSSVYQYDNGSTAKVTQSDYMGKSTVNQGSDVSTGRLFGFPITLPGVTGYANTAEVTQYGGYDTSTIGQYGNHNRATLDQDNNGINSTDASDIEQVGNQLYAKVVQSGSHDTSKVQQAGYDQVANVTQTGASDSSTVNQASLGAQFTTVSQTGDHETSIVDQLSLFGANTANVSQTLNNAYSHVVQTGSNNVTNVHQ